jgi:excisionase family DNA binding protein
MNKIIVTTEEALAELIKSSIRTALGEQTTSIKNSNSNEFFNIDEAAKFLKIPKASIYQLTSRLEIPMVKRSRRIFFKKSDLEAWLEGGRKKTRAEIEQEAMQELSNRRRR